ncbi:hypothetical protein Pint_23019 [Pistacia integerrima]|uniref:Uncharacterized protein n=1 Tax=Pistacia integerrima TaxID=434235 RepID=A0ACC0YIV8_9ROSI|nr:hypothetical protein Pint_23019 [Pistacia integerrima]
MENYNTDSIDAVLYVSGARLIKSGVLSTDKRDNLVTFVNAGGGAIKKGDSSVDLELDCYFEGGEVLRTNENIIDEIVNTNGPKGTRVFDVFMQ